VGGALEIYRRPANRFVADFIGRANFLPVTVLAHEKGEWRVRLADVELAVAAAPNASFAAGDQALLLVRPESLRIRAEGGGRMAGRIERTAYLGSLAEYDLELAGQRVAAVRYDPGEADLYPVSASVGVELIEPD
jgi:iron(III) transport system ATP-binding protein